MCPGPGQEQASGRETGAPRMNEPTPPPGEDPGHSHPGNVPIERDLVELLLEQAPEALIALSPDGTVLYWNPGARNLFGRDAEQARSEEHTSELQSRPHLVCRLLLEKNKN